MKLYLPARSAKRPWKRNLLAMLLLVAVAAAGLSPIWAAEKDAPYPEFRTSSRFSQAVQRVTGLTAVSGWVANRILKRELGRYLAGDVKSRLKLYSATDLVAGKARRFTVKGEHLLYDDLVPLSEFSLESDREMPLYVKKGKKPFLLRPVKFKLHAAMTEDDLNRMLKSGKGRKLLTAMTLDIPPFGKQELDVLDPAVTLENGKLTIKTLVNKHEASPENALPVEVSGKIYAEKSRLKLSEIAIHIDGMGEAREIARLIENYFAELVDFSKIKIDRHKLKVAFDKTQVADKRLLLEATVTVTPDARLIRELASQ